MKTKEKKEKKYIYLEQLSTKNIGFNVRFSYMGVYINMKQEENGKTEKRGFY